MSIVILCLFIITALALPALFIDLPERQFVIPFSAKNVIAWQVNEKIVGYVFVPSGGGGTEYYSIELYRYDAPAKK